MNVINIHKIVKLAASGQGRNEFATIHNDYESLRVLLIRYLKGNIMKLISIVTGCFNEEENIVPLAIEIRNKMAKYSNYNYEHIFIDNCSTDKTKEIIRSLAS